MSNVDINKPNTPTDFVLFWKINQPYGEFSNWYYSPFEINGVMYQTAEHYLMAEKARLMGDEETRQRILQTSSPERVKSLGREVTPFDENVWIDNRKRIMYEACYAKFNSSPKLKQTLLNTSNSIIVEASPFDRIWGIGLNAEHIDSKNPAKWRGLNLLGEVLMEVRERLK